MSGQTKRKIDVKAFSALLCVAACQVGQRATTPVCGEDPALDQDEPSQDRRREKPAMGARNRNRHNASGEEEPNCRVQDLNSNQNASLF